MPLSGLNNPFNRYALLLRPTRVLIDWRQKGSLLAQSVWCERCDADCQLGDREWNIDGHVWRRKNRHEISETGSIRPYTFDCEQRQQSFRCSKPVRWSSHVQPCNRWKSRQELHKIIIAVWNTGQWPKTGETRPLFRYSRKETRQFAQTTGQSPYYPTWAKSCSKYF